MIYPSIDEITKGKYNRYTLCIATAKCARMVTDEYVEQREIAEKMLANKETDKSLASMIKKEIRDEKAVKNAIKRLYSGEFYIRDADEVAAEKAAKAAEEAEAAAKAAAEQAEAAAASAETPAETEDASADASEEE